MEEIINVVLQVVTLLIGGGFMAAILSYMRNRRKDSLDAYSDLYEKIVSRCDKCEAEIEALRVAHAAQIAEKDSEIRKLSERVSLLEREALEK